MSHRTVEIYSFPKGNFEMVAALPEYSVEGNCIASQLGY